MKERVCNFYKHSKELNNNPTQVILTQERKLNRDNKESIISTANVMVVRNEESKMCGRMVIKTPYNLEVCIERFPECSVESIMNKYKKLKECGVPVVPTLRYDPENVKFLMTDMTQNGKNIIIDKHRKLKDVKFAIKNTKEIKEEAIQIALTSWENEVFLYSDAYAVVVDKKTKIGKLMVLDFGQCSYEIKHRYCLIYNTKQDAVDRANFFLDNYLSKH